MNNNFEQCGELEDEGGQSTLRDQYLTLARDKFVHKIEVPGGAAHTIQG